jgi:hypothetical protein
LRIDDDYYYVFGFMILDEDLEVMRVVDKMPTKRLDCVRVKSERF